MKNLLLLLCLFISIRGYNQSMPFINLTKLDELPKAYEIILGEWIFKELQDKEGNKIDTIYHSGYSGHPIGSKEIVNRPDINLKPNGTYYNDFTSDNRDEGHWKLDKASNKILYQLEVNPSSAVGNHLISIGEAEEQKDGKFYNPIEFEIYHLSSDLLVIRERGGYYQVYIRPEN